MVGEQSCNGFSDSGSRFSQITYAYKYLPAISDATFPKTVAVVVVAKRTPSLSLRKIRFGFTEIFLSCVARKVSDLPGMSVEFL